MAEWLGGFMVIPRIPHRVAWARASREYSHLKLARAAVNLYLGCGQSTGNVERFLNYVSQREHVRSVEFVHEAMLCSQCPDVEEVATVVDKKITPVGNYMQQVLGAYKALYGGRKWSKTPKARRDKQMARKDAKNAQSGSGVARPTAPDGEPEHTEAAFLRKREREIRTIREGKRARTVGAFDQIPEDTGLYVTEEVQKVRACATQRERAKIAGPSASAVEKGRARHAKAKRDAQRRRWVGRGAEDGREALVARPGLVWTCKELLDCHVDTLSRRQFQITKKWPQYALWSMMPGMRGRGVIILHKLHEGTLKSCQGLLARTWGGFVTTVAWMSQALASGRPPSGCSYTGIINKRLIVCLSPKLQGKNPSAMAAFCALAERNDKLHIHPTVAALNTAAKEYAEDRGPLSRPWTKFAVIIDDEENVDDFVGNEEGKCYNFRIAQSLDTFLSTHSTVVRDAVCPGWGDDSGSGEAMPSSHAVPSCIPHLCVVVTGRGMTVAVAIPCQAAMLCPVADPTSVWWCQVVIIVQ